MSMYVPKYAPSESRMVHNILTKTLLPSFLVPLQIAHNVSKMDMTPVSFHSCFAFREWDRLRLRRKPIGSNASQQGKSSSAASKNGQRVGSETNCVVLHIHVICVYIYIHRERERVCVCVYVCVKNIYVCIRAICICVCIYIYNYIYSFKYDIYTMVHIDAENANGHMNKTHS